MKRQTKTTANQQEHESAQEHLAASQTQQSPVQFGSVEEMIRHDAAQTPVPPSVERRVAKSVAGLAPHPRPWWRRWFGS